MPVSRRRLRSPPGAATVPGMTTQSAPPQPTLATVAPALGDVVTLPDRRALTVRAVMLALPHPVGPMRGFALCGEVGPSAALLTLPADPGGPLAVYRPLDRVPAHAADAQPVCFGTMPYWAPHLPGLRAAMGSLGYKVCVVRGQSEPMVLLWRGTELVVFVRTAGLSPADVAVTLLRRDENMIGAPVTRVAAAVTSPDRLGGETTDDSLYRRLVKR